MFQNDDDDDDHKSDAMSRCVIAAAIFALIIVLFLTGQEEAKVQPGEAEVGTASGFVHKQGPGLLSPAGGPPDD